jgi:transcriptional regulator with XRE-family HTH domain
MKNKKRSTTPPTIPPLPAAIAKRLRSAREHAGLSQGQVAKLLGFQRPTISEVEAGGRLVSAEELTKFCEIYGVSISWVTTAQPEIVDPKVEIPARELAKLKGADLDKVMSLLKMLRKAEGEPPTVPPLPGGEERGEGEPKSLADYVAITRDWGATNRRRRCLIEKKATKTIRSEEKEELKQLQRLAGLKRELLSSPSLKELGEMKADLRRRGLWRGL